MGEYENVISFREQVLACQSNGLIRREKCPACSQGLMLCLPFGGFCNSGNCQEKRLRGERVDMCIRAGTFRLAGEVRETE